MNTFSRANEALQHDLAAYANTLSSIVATIPQAQALCDQVCKEARLAEALLAFASGPVISEIGQIVFHLGNLWPYREQAYARTSGFADEIAEARRLREEARRGALLLARLSNDGLANNDGLASEVITCLDNIAVYLEQEQRLLETCHSRIRPHTSNMDITRKRLHLLAAALDARLPVSPAQQEALQSYNAAMTLLRAWEGGVPLDATGVEVLDRCLDLLKATDGMLLVQIVATAS